VIAVADTFDALTTNRPYQHAYPPEEALKIIHSLAGKRLDPGPVAALVAAYGRGEIRIQRSIAIKRTVSPDAAARGNVDVPLPAPIPATQAAEAGGLERTRV
jgi:hypothetical protein